MLCKTQIQRIHTTRKCHNLHKRKMTAWSNRARNFIIFTFHGCELFKFTDLEENEEILDQISFDLNSASCVDPACHLTSKLCFLCFLGCVQVCIVSCLCKCVRGRKQKYKLIPGVLYNCKIYIINRIIKK